VKYVAAVAVVIAATAARAAELTLPRAAAEPLRTIAAACPECEHDGYLACGSPEVAWGRGFAAHAPLGRPPRAYLVASAPTGEEFRTLARSTPFTELPAVLHHRFAAARLVVWDDGFTAARVLASPSKVAVGFSWRLHACLYGTEKPWGCCVAEHCDDQCCEKDLGSPTVTLEWKDGDESLTLHYSHTVGVSSLVRTTTDGPVRYACLTDARGRAVAAP
jgi:hypothetical protein